MFPELKNAIDFENSANYCTSFIGISQQNTNGSFVIHHFLSYFIKQGNPVCFVALAQSFSHYNTVAMKNGINLKEKRDNKDLLFIEGLKLIGQKLYENTEKNCNANDISENPVYFDDQKNLRLEQFYKFIKETCLDFFVGRKNVVIIFDDISTLSSIGATYKDMVLFVQHVAEFCHENSTLSSLVLLVDDDDTSEDDEMTSLWKFIHHNCTTAIEVSGLKTGYCRDVHGEVFFSIEQIKIWKAENLNARQAKKTFQYKLLDKNVAIFASGLSSAVL